MASWILIYDRRAGHLVRHERFDDGGAALVRRFELEREVPPDTEVVVLDGESLEDLRSTHARYFLSFQELADPARVA